VDKYFEMKRKEFVVAFFFFFFLQGSEELERFSLVPGAGEKTLDGEQGEQW